MSDDLLDFVKRGLAAQAAIAKLAPPLEAGQPAWAHSNGSYYGGTIVEVSKTRVRIEFTTGSGRHGIKWFKQADEGKGWKRRLPGEPRPLGARQLRKDGSPR